MVYLLHFSEPYKHTRHYVGWTANLEGRMHCHRIGKGARLTAAVAKAGIEMMVAKVWPDGDRVLERKLHLRKNNARYCPICKSGEK